MTTYKKLLQKKVSAAVKKTVADYLEKELKMTQKAVESEADFLIEKINAVIKTEHVSRSLRQLHTWWMYMRYMEYNAPDVLTNGYKNIFGKPRKKFDAGFWSDEFKGMAGIDSISFDKLDGQGMSNLFDRMQIFLAKKVFDCEPEQLDMEVRNWYGSYTDKKFETIDDTGLDTKVGDVDVNI